MTDDTDDLLKPQVFEEEEDTAPDADEPEAEVVAEPAKTGEPDAAPPAATDRDQRHVPIEALLSERDKRKDLEKRLAELEAKAAPQPEVPDFLENPDARLAHEQQRIAQLMWSTKLDTSETIARSAFGDDVVTAATEAFQAAAAQAPHLAQELRQQRHPYGFVVEWHKRQQALSEIGTDPAAYRAKLEAEIREKILAERQSAPPSSGPSLAGQANLGTRAAPEWGGPMPLDEILGSKGSKF